MRTITHTFSESRFEDGVAAMEADGWAVRQVLFYRTETGPDAYLRRTFNMFVVVFEEVPCP